MDDQGRLREVSWQELFPWLRIVSALRLAVSPSLLALAQSGLWRRSPAGDAIGRLYSDSEMGKCERSSRRSPFGPGIREALVRYDRNERALRPKSSWRARQLRVPWQRISRFPTTWQSVSTSPFLDVWSELSDAFRDDVRLASGHSSIYFAVYSWRVWALMVWSLFGSAITRIAAVALAHGDRLGFRRGACARHSPLADVSWFAGDTTSGRDCDCGSSL